MNVQRKTIVRICIILAAPILLLAGCISVDLVILSAARPPKDLKTIQDFELWKGKASMGRRTYENSGTNYTVILGPAGRTLPSGPSAYLFDQNGNFVDWTSDLGDLRTERYQLDLTGGRVKRLEDQTQ
jgi:hypothetical protein